MRYKVFDVTGSRFVFVSDNKEKALDFIAENCEKYGCLTLIDTGRSLKLSEVGKLKSIDLNFELEDDL